MPKVSVIVPIYNALDDLNLLLESMLKNFNFNLGDITLINDYSNQETSDFLQTFCFENNQFRLLNNEENLGFVKTCNRGIREAKGDIVVLLNSDTQIPKEFCERIIQCFESNNKIGVASPISSHTCEYFIPLPKNYTVERMNKLLRKKHECTYPLIPAAEGFCFCIRKEVIKQQGFFDEIWGKGYHEEVDFAYRSVTNGWKNVLIDDLYVYHKRQASFGSENREKLIEQNNPEFFKRWDGFRDKYIKENNLVNPVLEIEKKMFPANPIFSINYTRDFRHKIVRFLGIKIKIKRGNDNV